MTNVSIDLFDIVIKALIGAIGIGSSLLTWFAKQSFEQVKLSLDKLTETVNKSETGVAVLVSRSTDIERRLEVLEQRVQSLESEARQIREG
jgi:cell division protein FtsB